CDLPEVILPSLFYGYMNRYAIFGQMNNAVGYNPRIAKTVFIIFLYNFSLVFFIFFPDKLGRLENSPQALSLGLLHRLSQALITQSFGTPEPIKKVLLFSCQGFVPVKLNVFYLYLLSPVYNNSHDYGITG